MKNIEKHQQTTCGGYTSYMGVIKLVSLESRYRLQSLSDTIEGCPLSPTALDKADDRYGPASTMNGVAFSLTCARICNTISTTIRKI